VQSIDSTAPDAGQATARQAPELRQYQRDVIEQTKAAKAAGKRRIIIVAPTGSGKTVIAAKVIADAVRGGGRALFLAHRRELVQQASAKLFGIGVDHGIIQAGFSPRPGEAVQVASIPTLHARAVRTATIDLPDAEFIIVDEAHHAPARTYRRLLDAYPESTIIGLTATPCRGDGRGLGSTFETMVECPPVVELIATGYLVPTKVFAPSRPDLRGVQVQRGDYVKSQLAERMLDRRLVGDIVATWHRLAEGRKTVVFATGVEHSVFLRNEFRASGVAAEHIDGSTPAAERDDILRRLSSGAIDVVTNCMVLTEGWDQPDVSCLVLARPTKHRGLYLQMVGRGMRPAPGKTDVIVLDHAGAVFEHGFAEDPVSWTLDPDERAANPAHAARGKHGAPALRTCPECKAVRLEGRPCEVCGWQPRPKPKPVEVAEGDLAAVDRNRNSGDAFDPTERLMFYRRLLWIAYQRGYKKGWAAHKFREKFSSWPPRTEVSPLEPDRATLAWVRSRQIAYAKALKGQAEGAQP
jgi:DNA repair protein RadD